MRLCHAASPFETDLFPLNPPYRRSKAPPRKSQASSARRSPRRTHPQSATRRNCLSYERVADIAEFETTRIATPVTRDNSMQARAREAQIRFIPDEPYVAALARYRSMV